MDYINVLKRNLDNSFYVLADRTNGRAYVNSVASVAVCLYGSSCDSWSTSPSSATSRHTSQIFCIPAGLLTHIPWNCCAFGHEVGLSRSENSLEVRRTRLQRRSCKVVEHRVAASTRVLEYYSSSKLLE